MSPSGKFVENSTKLTFLEIFRIGMSPSGKFVENSTKLTFLEIFRIGMTLRVNLSRILQN